MREAHGQYIAVKWDHYDAVCEIVRGHVTEDEFRTVVAREIGCCVGLGAPEHRYIRYTPTSGHDYDMRLAFVPPGRGAFAVTVADYLPVRRAINPKPEQEGTA